MNNVTPSRKIYLDAQQCYEISCSFQGSAPLNNPLTVKFSSKDPNRGLYPKVHARHRSDSRFKTTKPDHIQLYQNMNDKDFRKSPDDPISCMSMSNSQPLDYSSTSPWLCAERMSRQNDVQPRVRPLDLTAGRVNEISFGHDSVAIALQKSSNAEPANERAKKNCFHSGFDSTNGNCCRSNAHHSAGLSSNADHTSNSLMEPLPAQHNRLMSLDVPADRLCHSTDIVYRPWLHDSPKRQSCNFDREDELGSPSKVYRRSSAKRSKVQTPQKNTLFKYFSPTKSNGSAEKKDSVMLMERTENSSSSVVHSKVVRPLFNENLNAVKMETITGNSLSGNIDSRLTEKVSTTATLSDIRQLHPIEIKKDASEPSTSKLPNDKLIEMARLQEDSDATDISDDELERLKETCQMNKELADISGLLSSNKISWDWEDDKPEERPMPVFLLPEHVLENIFCRIPFQTLNLSLRLVNKQWNDVISNDQFMHWKKKYYQLKHGDETVKIALRELCNINNMNSAATCLENLFRFVKDFRILSSSIMDNMIDCLKRHGKYTWMEDSLATSLPDCFKDKRPNPWTAIAMICVLAHNVKDVMMILKHLTHSDCSCTVPDLVDFMYCLATFFFYFRTELHISSRYHYRLYYSLYLFENKGMVTAGDLSTFKNSTSGQQTIQRYGDDNLKSRLTQEQMRIVNHDLQQGDTVKIVAFAGTGKTTTLVEFTKMWPSKRFLNVVYNKSVCKFAQKIFPPNVTCRTVHSLAYELVGKWFRSKLVFKLKPYDLMDLLEGENKFVRAGAALKTINEFISSADDFITTAHVPNDRVTNSGNKVYYSWPEKLGFCDDATAIWNKMRNVHDYQAKINHDVYLKVYQLEKFSIDNYDCILLDEVQDYSPAMLSIFTQQQIPKILVGDPHQQIYAFRGAVNALDIVQATHTYYLTQSFRFGPEIAYIASCALEVMKQETRKTIVGGEQPGTVNGTRSGQLAIIARTNFTLFSEAVRLCCIKKEPIHGHFLGGLVSYSLDQIMDVYNLMIAGNQNKETQEPLQIKNAFIRRFKSFSALQNYALLSEDMELQGKIKIVTSFHTHLPSYVEKIKQCCHYPLEWADVVFTTAHKAKGHEFDTVYLTEDYVPNNFFMMDLNIRIINAAKDADEANTLYVAITRAKRHLIMSSPVVKMMLYSGEKFEYPYATNHFRDKDWVKKGELICVSCNETKELKKELPLILYRQSMTLTYKLLKEGPLCYKCSTSSLYQLNEFVEFQHQLEMSDFNHVAMRFLLNEST